MRKELQTSVELERHAAVKAVGTESQPTFRPFNADRPLRVYYRHLPHWRQPGATYFVTFRQADSIPKAVLAEWLEVRQRWYRAHGLDVEWLQNDPDRFATAYAKIFPGIRQAFERQQARFLHDELDHAHGSCVLRHPVPQQELVQSLSHFHTARIWLGDFVVMPNHVQALIQPFDSCELARRRARLDQAVDLTTHWPLVDRTSRSDPAGRTAIRARSFLATGIL